MILVGSHLGNDVSNSGILWLILSHPHIKCQNMKCKNCGTEYKNRASNYCSTDCAVEHMDKSEED